MAQCIVRFDRLIKRNGKKYCWFYRGPINPMGYGWFTWRYKGVQYKNDAHRFAWMIYKGEIPEGKFVCHSCDEKSCVKPGHLWIGTAKENTADMIRKGRMITPDRKGVKNGRALLSEKQVNEIRGRFQKRIVTAKMLGDRYGVRKGVIDALLQRRTWAHI